MSDGHIYIPRHDPMLMKERRTELGITQDALARACGCGIPHISKVERGLESPSPELVKLIAEALGVRFVVILEDWFGLCPLCHGTGEGKS